MKRYYYIITSILFFGLLSCSNEETKTQTSVTARPTVPLQNGEVQIGTQIWMTKNLNVSRYRNGDPVPQVTNQTQWANLTTGAWCYYGNNTANGPVYGKLYNWYAVNDPRGLAPTGYHVPSDAEWTTLTTFLGGLAVAGGKMKATTLWNAPNLDATNSSGFTGLPAGFCGTGGGFEDVGDNASFWSSSYNDGEFSWSRHLLYDYGIFFRIDDFWGFGLSVRCLRD